MALINVNSDWVIDGTLTSKALKVTGLSTALPTATWSEDFSVSLGDFTTSGDAVWTRVTDDGNGDLFSARSGAIGHREYSKLTVTKTTTHYSSYFQYDYKTSTEEGFDYLNVYVDGVIQKQYSGTNAWTTDGVFIFGIGSHTVDFVYYKDNNTVGGTDQVWVDNVGLYNNYFPDVEIDVKPVFKDEVHIDNNLLVNDTIYSKSSYFTDRLQGYSQTGTRTFNVNAASGAIQQFIGTGEIYNSQSASLTQLDFTLYRPDTQAEVFKYGWSSATWPGGYFQMGTSTARFAIGQFVTGTTEMMTINGTSRLKDDVFIDGLDVKHYHLVNASTPSHWIGFSDTEYFKIKVHSAVASQECTTVDFESATASATVDRGRFRFIVDGTQIAGVKDAGFELTVNSNATTDTDKFLVNDAGIIKYRTGAEVLSDIGGAASSAILDWLRADTTDTFAGSELIFDNGGLVDLTINTNNGFEIKPNTGSGGWARGIIIEKASDGLRLGGAGFLGSGETISNYYIGFQSDWWSGSQFTFSSTGNLTATGTGKFGTGAGYALELESSTGSRGIKILSSDGTTRGGWDWNTTKYFFRDSGDVERFTFDYTGNFTATGDITTNNGGYLQASNNYDWTAANSIGVRIGTPLSPAEAGEIDLRRWTGTGTLHDAALITQTQATGGWGLNFLTNNQATNIKATTTRMYISPTGNVGIGTTAPVSSIGRSVHVYSDSNLGTVADNTALYVESVNRNATLTLRGSATSTNTINFLNNTGTTVSSILAETSTQEIYFRTGGVSTEKMRLTSAGNLNVLGTVQGTRLISTIATGTAPLTVSSTTKVTNLNADLFDNFDSTAYVKTFRDTNSAITATSSDLDTHSMGMYYGSGSLNLPPVGNSFITAHFLNAGSGYSQQIGGRNNQLYYRHEENGVWGAWERIVSDANATTVLAGNFIRKDVSDNKTSGTLTFNDNVALKLGNTTAGSYMFHNSAHTYWDLNVGNLYLRDTGVNRFIFERTTGNLTITGRGIFDNQSSPEKISLYSVDELGDNYIAFRTNAATRTAYIGHGGTTTNAFYVALDANEPMIFTTNGTQRMRINAGGNIVIGSGGTDTYKLDVEGTGRFTGKVTFDAGFDDTDTTGLGRVGNLGLATITTTADWANLPVGYSKGVNATTTTGEPSGANHGYFHKIANRDVSGGWGGLWVDYQGNNAWIGRAANDTVYATWDKIISEGNASTALTQFLRSDVADTAAGLITFSAGLKVSSGQNIYVGSSNELAISYNSGLSNVLVNQTTGNNIVFQDSGTNRFIFGRTTGDLTLATGGVFTASNSVIGRSTVLPIEATATHFASATPRFEVLTGTAVGTYQEAMVLRHQGHDATAVTRRLGFLMKLSSESSAGESDKMGGMVLESANTFANSPDLHFLTADVKRMQIAYNGKVSIGNTNNIYQLDVYGDGRFYKNDTTLTPLAIIHQAGGGDAIIGFTQSANNWVVGIDATKSSFDIVKSTSINTTAYMSIGSTGNVSFAAGNITTTGNIKGVDETRKTVEDYAGTSRSITTTDSYKVVRTTSASAVSITVNHGALTNVGEVAEIDQYGSGLVTIVQGTNVLLRVNGSKSLVSSGIYSRIAIQKMVSGVTEEYRVFGELA